MGKQYHFLSGLYRSGNTLLSAILNQNKQIYVSSLSPVNEYMWQCFSASQYNENAILNSNKDRDKKFISSILSTYYSDIEKPIIFDRSKSWMTPDNVDMIKNFVGTESKIIFTIRPIAECVASLINIDKENLLDQMEMQDFVTDNSISENDNLVNYMISYHPLFTLNNFAHTVYELYKNKNFIHIVRYEDLTNDTYNTLDKIYNFLQLERYNHDLTNIQSLDFYNYKNVKVLPNMHDIRKNISKSFTDPTKIISEESIKKCNKHDLFYYF